MFVARGLRVVRFDNRDVGLSSRVHEKYTLSDMAADAVAVLDAIGVERAHVMGLSMGGMIVQTMAIEYPDRLLSMTSVMSRTGEPGYGESTPEAFALTDRAARHPIASRSSLRASRATRMGQPGVCGRDPLAPHRGAGIRSILRFRRCRSSVHGDRRVTATCRRTARSDDADAGDPRRQDTLIDISGGRRTAELIPGARFEVIEGHGPRLSPAAVGSLGRVASAELRPTSVLAIGTRT